jgi:hypothetical protein
MGLTVSTGGWVYAVASRLVDTCEEPKFDGVLALLVSVYGERAVQRAEEHITQLEVAKENE